MVLADDMSDKSAKLAPGAGGAAYKSYSWVARRWQISNSTLKLWADKGTVPVLRFPSGKRLYSVAHLEALLSSRTSPSSTTKENIIYARVSSEKQRADLQRQVAELVDAYPSHRLITDVASGINFHRKGLQTLLDSVLDGQVAQVVVMHRDRLARVAVELIEYILRRADVRFVVHRQAEQGSEASELADDLLAITTVFVASHNGKRSAENRRKRKQAALANI